VPSAAQEAPAPQPATAQLAAGSGAAKMPNTLRNIRTVFRRELNQYFTSPIAYLVAFAVLMLGGVVFNNDLAQWNGQQRPTDGTSILSYFALFTIFFAPLVTMRLLAEENREGTIELLMTLPVRDSEIVAGKFLGAWGYYSAVLMLTLVYQAILIWLSPPDLGAVISAYIGVWLYGGASIAVGILFSAITDNQIVAAFMSTAALMLLWLTDQVGKVINNAPLAEALRAFSFRSHYLYSFALGLVRLDDLVFFAGVIVGALFIAARLVESRRWR
jgi:ABC-2 type transport system permease protein